MNSILRDMGRFEPLDKNKWLGAHTINIPDMHKMDDTSAGHIMRQ